MPIRLNAAEIREIREKTQPPIPAKPNKYHSVKTEYGGILYDSKSEARRAYELDMMITAGVISWWIRQVTFRLGCPENVYRADFLVVEPMHVHVEDVKGASTRKFEHDVKLWRKYGPCDLHVIRKEGTEVIIPRDPKATYQER